MPWNALHLGIASVILTCGLAAPLAAEETATPAGVPKWRQHDIRRPKPPVAEPTEGTISAKPPKDAVVLFDGSNLNEWKSSKGGGDAKWTIGEGYLETKPGAGAIETKQAFGDMQLHVEWASPKPPAGTGQNRGNGGIFLMGQFEIQVLDSFQAETYADGQAGAIYGQYPPLFNATRPPGEWQNYDIAFRRARFDTAGKLLEPARITVFLNGLLVQNNEEPFGPTSWLRWIPYKNEGDRGPISLQDHSHPVRYRNIWLRELPERPAPTPKDLERPPTVAVSTTILDQYVGKYFQNEKSRTPSATITRDGDHLVIVFTTRPRTLVLEPISETVFDLQFTDGRFTFQKDDKGIVTGVHFQIGDGERILKKVAK